MGGLDLLLLSDRFALCQNHRAKLAYQNYLCNVGVVFSGSVIKASAPYTASSTDAIIQATLLGYKHAAAMSGLVAPVSSKWGITTASRELLKTS